MARKAKKQRQVQPSLWIERIEKAMRRDELVETLLTPPEVLFRLDSLGIHWFVRDGKIFYKGVAEGQEPLRLTPVLRSSLYHFAEKIVAYVPYHVPHICRSCGREIARGFQTLKEADGRIYAYHLDCYIHHDFKTRESEYDSYEPTGTGRETLPR
jgi:hypothetical protein